MTIDSYCQKAHSPLPQVVAAICIALLWHQAVAAQPPLPVPQANPPGLPTPAAQDSPATIPSPADGASLLDGPSLKDVPTWSQLARAILLTAIPDKYEDLKHWGMTRSLFDGLNVKQRGFDVRVSERRKRVNHGAWYKFSVQFPNPEQNLNVVIDQVQTHSVGHFSFAIHVAIKNIRVIGQFENWILGAKGLNFDVVSDAEVHLHAVCDLSIQTETRPKSILPDLVLDPKIRSIQLDLADLETHRIGRLGGDIAEELGNGSRQFIKELMHSQEGRVLKKANEAIEKKRDSLRLPVSKLW